MIPSKFNIEAWESASRSIVFVFKDSFGNLIDLSGFTARLQVRSSASDESTTPLLELTTENDGITIDGPAGKVTVFIEDVLASYSGVYDLLLISQSGIVYKPIKTSKFKVIPGVTHNV
ncbi:hypothetical protein EKI60_04595 [Candidatus Saccharibacteria bacterium]|nr:MAG: hypothetical protein EKI60_04595 [Candidatus Saccharibacteria bacterium]